MKREVDPRLDDAEDKGRGYVLALIDVILIKYRRPDLTSYACIADEGARAFAIASFAIAQTSIFPRWE